MIDTPITTEYLRRQDPMGTPEYSCSPSYQPLPRQPALVPLTTYNSAELRSQVLQVIAANQNRIAPREAVLEAIGRRLDAIDNALD